MLETMNAVLFLNNEVQGEAVRRAAGMCTAPLRLF